MAAWTDVTTLISSLLAGKAFTEGKAAALAENVAALAEGATGADRVQGRALDVFLGRYVLTTTTGTTITGLERHTHFRAWVDLRDASGLGSALRIEVSNDSGSTFSPDTTLVTASSATGWTQGELFFDIATGAWAFAGTQYDSTGPIVARIENSGTLSVPADADAIRLHLNRNTTGAIVNLYALGGA